MKTQTSESAAQHAPEIKCPHCGAGEQRGKVGPGWDHELNRGMYDCGSAQSGGRFYRSTGCTERRLRQINAALLEALEDAAERMERARHVLTHGKPSYGNNWGMLDASTARAAIALAKGEAQ